MSVLPKKCQSVRKVCMQIAINPQVGCQFLNSWFLMNKLQIQKQLVKPLEGDSPTALTVNDHQATIIKQQDK